jgi:hypothetical protein
MPKNWGLWVAAVIAIIVVGAALTKPSRETMHAAARHYAGNASVVSSIATDVTGVFGNDTYDDYILFSRYRVYVGSDPTVDCYGAFASTTCATPKPRETTQN